MTLTWMPTLGLEWQGLRPSLLMSCVLPYEQGCGAAKALDLPASRSQVLGLQADAPIPGWSVTPLKASQLSFPFPGWVEGEGGMFSVYTSVPQRLA